MAFHIYGIFKAESVPSELSLNQNLPSLLGIRMLPVDLLHFFLLANVSRLSSGPYQLHLSKDFGSELVL